MVRTVSIIPARSRQASWPSQPSRHSRQAPTRLLSSILTFAIFIFHFAILFSPEFGPKFGAGLRPRRNPDPRSAQVSDLAATPTSGLLFFQSTEGAPPRSTGQHPGDRSEYEPQSPEGVRQGRNAGLHVRPEVAPSGLFKLGGVPNPRALPWAAIGCPCGAEKAASLYNVGLPLFGAGPQFGAGLRPRRNPDRRSPLLPEHRRCAPS